MGLCMGVCMSVYACMVNVWWKVCTQTLLTLTLTSKYIQQIQYMHLCRFPVLLQDL
jgi:hypothetical protein